jgi:hypothetical protein
MDVNIRGFHNAQMSLITLRTRCKRVQHDERGGGSYTSQ